MGVENERRADAARRNLVIVRAGDASLHRGWGAGEPGCGFDLIVSYFGDDPAAFMLPHENRVDRKGDKWDGIHALLAERPDLLSRYDYFWLPDDDIEADRATIEGIFANMRRLDLHIAQPALTLDSYYSHFALLRCESFEHRLVDKIEIMAPCLRADVLATILPVFEHSMSGFGIDSLWNRLAADNRGKSAVFDALPVRHTRPVGSSLKAVVMESGRTREEELSALRSQYGFEPFFPLSYEALDRRGRHWRSQKAIGLRMVADYASARSAFRQVRRFKKSLWRLLSRQYFKSADLSPVTLAAPE